MRSLSIVTRSLVIAAICLWCAGVARADSAEPGPCERVNHPPYFEHPTPHQFGAREGTAVRYGKEVRILLDARDPDGDPLTFTATGLPTNSTFRTDFLEFVWTPREQDLGEHVILFAVSDGKDMSRQLIRLVVVEDRAPTAPPAQERTVTAGQTLSWSMSAQDPDGDPVTYRAEALPPGASFDPHTGQLSFTPEDAQAGTYRVRFEASDGQKSSFTTLTVQVIEEWTSYLLPGVRYAAFVPVDSASLGILHGVSLELAPITWVHRNQNRGPSHGRVYLTADLLSSTLPDAGLTLVYGAGFSLSIERNPQRRWLIPMYGAELGGIIQPQVGNKFQLTPYAGLHLWSSRNVFVNLNAGYLIAPAELERLRGWKASLGIDLTLW